MEFYDQYQDRNKPMKAPLVLKDDAGVTVIQLRSVTVLWTEFGIDINDIGQRTALSRKWPDIEDWLSEYCERTYRPNKAGIWFLEPNDAMLFKLTWAGMIL